MTTIFFNALKGELKKSFESRVTQLETKVFQLETKVAQQESLIASLRMDNPSSRMATDPTEIDNNESQIYSRTCQEIYDYDNSQSSGFYIIDPDGQDLNGESEEPFQVYCDMTTGATTDIENFKLKKLMPVVIKN